MVLGTPTVQRPSWQKYIRSPETRVIKPVDVMPHRIVGGVKYSHNLLHGNRTFLVRHSVLEDPPSLVVDFGRVVVGLLEIDFGGSHNLSAARPGIRLAFSETLEFLSHRSDYTRSDNARGDDKITNGTDQIAVRDGAYTWRNTRGCQYGRKVCADGLHGFRYVKISLDALKCDSPYTSSLGLVAISSVRLQWSGYLGTKESYLGWYEAQSDKDMTQWWYDAVYTAEMSTDMFRANETEPRVGGDGQIEPSSLEGEIALMDGAKRDREPYAGDLAIAALTMYIAHNESEAARNVLENLARHQREDGWIPPAAINNYSLPLFDYPLWWVVSAVDYVLYTGNRSFANGYWSVMTKTLDQYYHGFLSNDTGMLHKPADMGDYAFLPRSGPVTYFNALYIYALRRAGHLATTLDKMDDANRWYALANLVAHALWTRNFDVGHGAFYDGSPCPGAQDDTICDTRAQDGNMLAIVAGVTDQDTSNQILEYWDTLRVEWGSPLFDNSILARDRQLDQCVYPFMSYFEYAARLSVKTKKSPRKSLGKMHSWMARHDPKITTWEAIGAEGKPFEGGYTSMAHGWSTGIVSLLTNYDLGITPLEPGFETWQVCPSFQLGSTKGALATPLGTIKVIQFVETRHRMNEKRTQVEAPYGTAGKICLPYASSGLNANIVVNGYTVWSKRGPTTYVVPQESGMKIVLLDREESREYEVHLPRAEVDTITQGWNPYDSKDESGSK
ncbi:hypothetical protein CDD81_6455 [Ophiocordyceps australis]|uniref:Alpha-L-rhamnosidase six-hairpin glycosidase domain-containing protein n=1 Tax=Ophiocordyceps australis TaxID=1399860 RepID=A0A2C5XLT9_9HYPO|nr:hypothetical protein CDD81_6455 [Ophiocordyceps australis]